jgi:exosortase E/protease (VPEID-CTERM system)
MQFRPSSPWIRGGIPLAILGAAEALALSVWLDNASLSHASGLSALIGRWSPWAARFGVFFAVMFAAAGWRSARPELEKQSVVFPASIAGAPFFAAHLAAGTLFLFFSSWLYHSGPSRAGDLLAAGWILTGSAAAALLVFTFFPPRLAWAAIRSTRRAWAFATVAGLLGCLLGAASRMLWESTARLTFALATALLRRLVPAVVSDPAAASLRIGSFQVEIAPACSGLEGIGLVLAFGGMWLWMFRREFRLLRAILLLVCGACAVFLLNVVRIAALVWVGGVAGAPALALGGFHSQAGWLSFLFVAVGYVGAIQRAPWVAVDVRAADVRRRVENPSVPYLVPLLAILIAAMLARAASAGFEWLYPLRFAAAAAALWFYRRHYASLDWRCGWIGAAAGVLVFSLWIAADWLRGEPATGMPGPLAAAAPPVRICWIAVRALAATVTVPIAEELAFRAFLFRRCLSIEFESIRLQTTALIPVVVSSAAFGFLHGDRWLAGTIAGVVFWAAMRSRGRIGDAMLAHSVANALLAARVLLGGDWSVW